MKTLNLTGAVGGVIAIIGSSFMGCDFNDPSMIIWDSTVVRRAFCGRVVSLRSYKGSLAVGIEERNDTMNTAFMAEVDQQKNGPERYLERMLAIGDSVCKDSGAVDLSVKHHGEWKGWMIMDPNQGYGPSTPWRPVPEGCQ